MTHLNKRKGQKRNPRLNSCLQRSYLGFWQGARPIAGPENTRHAWSRQDRQSSLSVEAAKHIARKNWKLRALAAFSISMLFCVQGQKSLKALGRKDSSDHLVVAGLDCNSEPLWPIGLI